MHIEVNMPSRRYPAVPSAAPTKPSILPPRRPIDEPRGPRLLSRQEVVDRIGVTYPTLWAWMRAGRFPRSVHLSSTKVAWFENEIEEYIASLPRSRLKGDPAEAA
jgi:prophage regulatory protein